VVGVRAGHGTRLEVEEEKGPVLAVVDLRNPDGSANGAAEIVYSTLIAGVRIRAVGIEGFVGPVIVCRSMVLAGAGPHGVDYNGARRLTVFGREVTGLNRHFLYRIHAGRAERVIGITQGIGCIHAVDTDPFARGRRAIDTDRGEAEGAS